MYEPSFAHRAPVCPAMLARGARWGTGTGALFGVLTAASLVLFPLTTNLSRLLVGLGIAAIVGLLVGSISGFGLGSLGGGLLGLWTDRHPRPVADRTVYRFQAAPVVGFLIGGGVALALGGALLFVAPGVLSLAFTLLVAVEAALAAGWSTCRILGWYAAQPE